VEGTAPPDWTTLLRLAETKDDSDHPQMRVLVAIEAVDGRKYAPSMICGVGQ